MNTLELLIAARAKIDTPEKWVKRFAYANDVGNGVPTANRACRFCSVGAVWATTVDREDKIDLDGQAEEALARAITPGVEPDVSYYDYWDLVTIFNDKPGTTHADVMAMFDRAIESLKGNTNAD